MLTPMDVTETAGRYYVDGISFRTLQGALCYVSQQGAEPVLYMAPTPKRLCLAASSFIPPTAFRG